MADEAAAVEDTTSPVQVTLSFQRDGNRKQKYLEAEPKALGITQIGLGVFNITWMSVFIAKDITYLISQIPFFIASVLVAIAGGVALAAQNLHLPLLKACLGMQGVAGGASLFNIIFTFLEMNDLSFYCYDVFPDNETQLYIDNCRRIEGFHVHFYSEIAMIQLTLFAISCTLAAYCCKVVNCCMPAPKTPIITVQAPPVQQ